MDRDKRDARVDQFDADNSYQTNAGIFGLPFEFEEAEIVLYPVPWETTVSYRTGTAAGPMHLYEASSQIDLYDHQFGEIWKKGIFWFDAHLPEILRLNNNVRPIAQQYLTALQQGVEASEDIANHINATCAEVKETVKNVCVSLLEDDRKIGLVGGDHSTPQGYLEALSDKHGAFGVLQIDAHCDLRKAYEGFTYSHASIFYNMLEYNQELKLTQVGIRDYCLEEKALIDSDNRITTFFDQDIKNSAYSGKLWADVVKEVINTLPEKVYISLDVDGLQPDLCPNTGTPVPGGLTFEELAFLLQEVKESGKEVIGFDLSETGAAQWDGIVSSRLLYKLCGLF